jgi:hypothetical protein
LPEDASTGLVPHRAAKDASLGHEASHVVAAFDDREDQCERGQAVLDEGAGVAAVGPDQGEAVVCVGHLLEQDLCGGAVAGVRGGDHHAQQQTEGVDHDVSLAPIDQLAAVEATAVGADDGVPFDGLRVDNAGRRLRVAPLPLADLRSQPVVELLDQGVVAPAAEERVCPVPWREVGGHGPPLGSVVDEVADRVQYPMPRS